MLYLHAIFTMKKRFLFILFLVITTVSPSQSHEVGLTFGGSNFIGDIGRTNYVYPNKAAGGVIYKYNINTRIALRGSYTYLPISGDDADAENEYRKLQARSFNNTIHEFAAGVEINFYEYDIDNNKNNYTPYIFTKIATFNYKSPVEFISSNKVRVENKFSFSIPVGIGIKGHLFDDFAIGFEVGVRYTLSDDIDYSTPKIEALNFGGNGNDWYTFTGLSIVYNFGKPKCFSGLTR